MVFNYPEFTKVELNINRNRKPLRRSLTGKPVTNFELHLINTSINRGVNVKM